VSGATATSHGRPGPGDEGRAAVLDAAAKTFARRGYSGSSMDDIADELGATKGRVYHYYRSKARILEDVLLLGARTLHDAVAPVAHRPGLGPAERLEAMAVEHALVLMRQNDVQAVTLHTIHLVTGRASEPGEANPFRYIVDARDEYEELWRAAVRAGVADGVLHAPDPDLAVRAVLGALNWSTVWYRPSTHDTDGRTRLLAEGLASYAVRGVLRHAD
jgi:AcrR family transcriptional regulator